MQTNNPGKVIDGERKKKLTNRLSRTIGQLNAVKEMIESETDCQKVAMQLSAARAALDKTYFEMMACAIEGTVVNSIETNWQEQLDDLTTILVKYA